MVELSVQVFSCFDRVALVTGTAEQFPKQPGFLCCDPSTSFLCFSIGASGFFCQL